MDKINILEAIFFGTVVATFLLNTSRVLKAIEFCKECLILLNSKALKNHNEIVQSTRIVVYLIMLKGYNLINDRQKEGDIAFGLAKVYKLQSKYTEAEEMYTKALGIMTETGERFGEAKCHEMLGTVFRSLGEYGKAKKHLEKALVICKEIGNREGEATCYGNLGNVFLSLGEYDKAEDYFNKSLVEIGDRQEKANCYGNLGCAFQCLDKYGKAEEYQKKALAIRKEIGDRRGEAACYTNLGTVFASLCEYGKAEEYQKKALVINEEIGDREGKANCYANLGTVFESLSKFDKAKEYLNKALAIKKEIGDRGGEAACYESLSKVFESLCEYGKAEEYLENALVITKEIGDRRGEAACYGKLGTVFTSLREFDKAKQYQNKALVIRKEIGDRGGEAACYEKLSCVFESQCEYGKAEEYLENALVIRKEIGDRRREAACYGKLGVVFKHISEYGKAEEHNRKALGIAKEIGDREQEAACYTNLGSVFQDLAEYGKAEEYQKNALLISQDIGDRTVEAACYVNLGNVFSCLGNYGKAEEHYNNALEISNEIGDKKGEAKCYEVLGLFFIRLGENGKAEEYLQKALVIVKKIGHKLGEANCYGNLGTVFQSRCEYEEAEKYQHKSLAIRKEIGDRSGEACCYGSLGAVMTSSGANGKAKEYLEKALAIRKDIGDRDGEAVCYGNLGCVSRSLGEYAKAEEYHKKALSVSEETGHIQTQLESHLFLALVVLLDGRMPLEEACSNLFASIRKCEKMRRSLEDKDQFKISFLEEHVTSYRMLSALFCCCGYFNEALYVAELGRARALGDLMSAQYHVKQEISDNPQSWVGIEGIVNKEINCTCLYISYFGCGISMWVLKANKPIRFRHACDNECCVGKQLKRNVDEILSDETFRDFEEKEDEDQRSLPILAEWHKMIIAPVADLLEEPEIIIVPDRSLYKIPFAALMDESDKFLSETSKIRIVPSLSTLKLIQVSSADYHTQAGALIVGDPCVGTVIYKGKITKIYSLPSARREVEMIGRLLGVEPLVRKQATKQAVLQSIHTVSLIHFAAHGDAERGEIFLAPLESINVRPKDEHYLLTMSDISQVQLRAKLVVLSCCHSASGAIKAEGAVGIARAFLGSGARSVLVALWAISDSATEQLMSHFYEHLVRGESASDSLHEAMKWMRSNGFSHVKEWAPFMLIGDNVTFDFSK